MRVLTCLLSFAFAAPLLSQDLARPTVDFGSIPGELSAFAGPSPAPHGVPISVGLANDTHTSWFSDVCHFAVYDARGVPVYWEENCTHILMSIRSGESLVVEWNQLDWYGNPVLAVDYHLAIELPDGSLEDVWVTVGGT